MPQGTLGTIWTHFGVSRLGGYSSGIWLVGAKDAAQQHPSGCSVAPEHMVQCEQDVRGWETPSDSLGSLPQLQDEHPGASSTLAKGNERGRINKCQLQDFK